MANGCKSELCNIHDQIYGTVRNTHAIYVTINFIARYTVHKQNKYLQQLYDNVIQIIN